MTGTYGAMHVGWQSNCIAMRNPASEAVLTVILALQLNIIPLSLSWARSKNCEKLLLALSWLSRLSVRPHGTTQVPLVEFSRNLTFE
jgi:hypothetical protein